MALAYSATTITSGYNPTQINANWTAINTALQDGLSRSGNGPNAMTTNFDLGNQDLLNGGTINCADIIVAGSSVAASAAAAAASAAAASVSEANAATSETNAAASEAAAAASESSVAADAAAASASEAAAAISETNADADAVATAADVVSTAADAAATAADVITTTADALSCFNDAASASSDAASAFTSESNAATSASNASTSETNAAASAAAALVSELAAAAIVGGDQLTIGTGGTPPTTYKLELYDNSSDAVYTHYTNTTTGTAGTDGFFIGINGTEQAVINNKEATDLLIQVANEVVAAGIYDATNSDFGIYQSTTLYNINRPVFYVDTSANKVHITPSDGSPSGSTTALLDIYRGTAVETLLFIGNSATGHTDTAGLHIGVDSSGNSVIKSETGGAELHFHVQSTKRFEMRGDGLFIANTGTPATPSGGGQLYVSSGALRYIGSSGTDTLIAAA